MYNIIGFYKFFPSFDTSFKPWFVEKLKERDILGTIILAPEGINATLQGNQNNLELFLADLKQIPGFDDLFIKYAYNEKPIFRKRVVHVKKEIVTLKRPDINPTTKTAPHLNAKDWNKLLDDKDVVVIDTRNDYEVKTGTFPHSINPQNKTFGEFPDFVKNNAELFKNKKIAMFCTGGIRCEKATSLMMDLGYNEVYQLDGGIWNYLDTVPKGENKWMGECFVFDDRITVDSELHQGSFESFDAHDAFVKKAL